jgi:hypothetical protein
LSGRDRGDTALRLAAGIAGTLSVVSLIFLAIAIATRPADPPAPVRARPPAPSDASVPIDATSDAGALAADAPYALDEVSRVADPAAPCPEVPLVDYEGEIATWRPALRVHRAFVPRVRALERAVADAARDVYGRTPSRLLSPSSYRCSTVRDRPERISEHALGNAVDLRGIQFDVDGGTSEIAVRDHWGADDLHGRFLRRIVRLVVERGIVRGVIGPPARDHLDHFHFDMGPSRFVDVAL